MLTQKSTALEDVQILVSPTEAEFQGRQADDGLVAQVADAIRATVNHPWPDGGPSIQDVGDRPFLAYFEGDGWRELYHEAFGLICFADGRPVTTLPVVWRTMPPAPTEGR